MHVNASTFDVHLSDMEFSKVLSLDLYSVYISDLPLFIKACCEFFADYTTIHSSNDNLEKLSGSLQESVNSLLEWADLKRMSLRPDKTKFVYNNQAKETYFNCEMLGVLMHRIMSENAPPSLTTKISLNQLSHSAKLKTKSLEFTRSILGWYTLAVFFGTQSLTRLDYHLSPKRLNHVTCHTFYADWLSLNAKIQTHKRFKRTLIYDDVKLADV